MMEYGDWIEQEAEEQRREEHAERVARFLPVETDADDEA